MHQTPVREECDKARVWTCDGSLSAVREKSMLWGESRWNLTRLRQVLSVVRSEKFQSRVDVVCVKVMQI